MKIITIVLCSLVSLAALAEVCSNDDFKVSLDRQCLSTMSAAQNFEKIAKSDEAQGSLYEASNNYRLAYAYYFIAGSICNSPENPSPMGPVPQRLMLTNASNNLKANQRVLTAQGVPQDLIDEGVADVKAFAKSQLDERKVCARL